MAWPTFTTTELLSAVRMNARLSDYDPDWTTAQILLAADKMLQERFWPFMLSLRSDFGLAYLDHTITAAQQAYALPKRAYGSTLRRVLYVGATSSDVYELSNRPMGEHTLYAGETGSPEAYCIHDDKIMVLPTPASTTGTLRVYYERRPSQLIATSSAMQITAGVGTGVLTGAAPAAWTTGLSYDIIKNTSPFATINEGLTASAVSASTSITFTLADLDSTRLAVGDWVTESGYSPIPQMPMELHSVLSEATASHILKTTGAYQASKALEQSAAVGMGSFQRAVSPRYRNAGRTVFNPNSPFRNRGGFTKRILDDGQA